MPGDLAGLQSDAQPQPQPYTHLLVYKNIFAYGSDSTQKQEHKLHIHSHTVALTPFPINLSVLSVESQQSLQVFENVNVKGQLVILGKMFSSP